MTDYGDIAVKALAALAYGLISCILIFAVADASDSIVISSAANGVFCLLVAWATVTRLPAYWPSMVALNAPNLVLFSFPWFDPQNHSGRMESVIILPFAVLGTIAGAVIAQRRAPSSTGPSTVPTQLPPRQ